MEGFGISMGVGGGAFRGPGNSREEGGWRGGGVLDSWIAIGRVLNSEGPSRLKALFPRVFNLVVGTFNL